MARIAVPRKRTEISLVYILEDDYYGGFGVE
jgi:hypothetical protein